MSSEGEIRRLRSEWVNAVKAKDLDRLLELVTDDVVVIHPNGRSTLGKVELRADLESNFARFTIKDQIVEAHELIVSGDWAFERAAVKTSVAPANGEPFNVESTTIVILNRKTTWKISRTIAV